MAKLVFPRLFYNKVSIAGLALTLITGLTIVEPEGSDPWDFSGDWSVKFEIIRRE